MDAVTGSKDHEAGTVFIVVVLDWKEADKKRFDRLFFLLDNYQCISDFIPI